jgi:CheY-like chemotaxis protein
VVLDLLMPGMNGFEFLDQLRQTPAGRAVPVIVWTVKDITEPERVRLRQSAQAVVQKVQGGAGALVEGVRPYLRSKPDGAGQKRLD